jgi:hypothetical protein
MPYFTITDFAAGLDLRRSSLTAPAGTLRSMINCHITPGGEIEKRMAFVPFWTADPASKGLVEVNQKLYVFGPNGPYTTEPPGMSATPQNLWTVGVLGLETPTIFEIIDYDLFDNKVFSIVWTNSAGNVMRFYDGANVPDANGFYCRTYKTKVYAVAGSVLYFSSVGNAGDWSGTGSGAIDLSLEDSDMSDCIALEVYYNNLAVMSKTATQLWLMDPDPLKNQYVQTLRQAGTMAWRSVMQYGSGDVMYLAPSGIRSLRARNASLAAAVSDIGSPLDPVIQDLFRYRGEDWMSGTIAILQPVTGRFWVIFPDRIYILSAFPGPKITAWSEYDPGFPITAATVYQNRVVVRDDKNIIYAFGGTDPNGPVYDDCYVELVFPFHAGTETATYKTFTGLDATCDGVPWDVYAAFNVEDDTAEDFLGSFNGPTFLQGNFPVTGHSTHMSLRLRSQSAGPQTLSNMVVHYQLSESG